MQSLPRALLITALIGVLVALAASIAAGGAATRAAATHTMATRAVEELATLAGLVGEDGELLRAEPMPVEVVSESGPMWVLSSVERAVEGDDYFSVGDSPHLLRIELIAERRALALQLHLWRGGWELREPARAACESSPGLPSSPRSSARAWRYSCVGRAWASPRPVCSRSCFWCWPGRHEKIFPPRSLLDAWAEGPLFGRVIPLIREMETLAMAVLVAVLAGSLVLVAFDHRRTRGADQDVGLGLAALSAVFVTIGALAWIEAASRASLFAACDLRFGAYFGVPALVGLILAWLPAIRVGREAWRARE